MEVSSMLNAPAAFAHLKSLSICHIDKLTAQIANDTLSIPKRRTGNVSYSGE
jgi:hypothetical protein